MIKSALQKKIYKVTKSKVIASNLLHISNNSKDKRIRKQLNNQLYNCCSIATIEKEKKEVSFIYKNANRYVSRYCNSRTCMVCNSIKMNKYYERLKFLENEDDLWFLTLTIKNCTENNLENVLLEMRKTLRLITNKTLKKLKISSICKFECTYNVKANTYHPHVHIIIKDNYCANSVLKLWKYYINKSYILKKMYNTKDDLVKDNGLDLRKFDKKHLLDIIKYELKIYKTKVYKNGKRTIEKINYKSLYNITTAFYKKRTFSLTGDYYKLKDKINIDINKENIQKIVYTEEDFNTNGIFMYSGRASDYLDTNNNSIVKIKDIEIDKNINKFKKENLYDKNVFKIYNKNIFEIIKENSIKEKRVKNKDDTIVYKYF